MAFPRLFHPALLTTHDLCEPEHFSVPALGLLNGLFSDRVPRRHLIIRPKRHTCLDLESSGKFVDLSTRHPNKFQVMLNVKHFKPDELSIKTVDNYVVIHGKHEDSADEHGFVNREFTRRYAIPDGVEVHKIQASWSQDEVLTIHAPMKAVEPPTNERVVPIFIQQSAAAEQQEQ